MWENWSLLLHCMSHVGHNWLVNYLFMPLRDLWLYHMIDVLMSTTLTCCLYHKWHEMNRRLFGNMLILCLYSLSKSCDAFYGGRGLFWVIWTQDGLGMFNLVWPNNLGHREIFFKMFLCRSSFKEIWYNAHIFFLWQVCSIVTQPICQY